tara:strand:- start:1240 stop:1629 length:390 start_codon:yes stop_codon:yes gene_type:complete
MLIIRIMIFNFFNTLNQSKYFAGIMMIVLNLGSKYITMELSENQDELFKNKIIRRFLVFTVVFVATRDIFVSLIITGVFIILVSGLFNENSRFALVTKPVISRVTEEEYRQAKKIVRSFELQKKNSSNV